VSSKPDIDTVPELKDAISQAESELGEDGRVLVRYSGTQNMCRVMVEGPTHEITEKYCTQLAELVERVLGASEAAAS
ncbi:MAG: phosphoglucosamine mutase, partial [Desulfomonilia bacterium]